MDDKGSKRFAKIIKHRYDKARELSEDVFNRIEVNRNLYKGYLQLDDAYEWDYSLVDQQVFPLIRNYISRSNPSMTKIRLEARKPEDFEKRQVNQDFINWEISEIDLTTILTRAFFSNYLTGKAYFKTGWKYEPRIVVENGKYKYEMRPLTNRADLKFVRFNNILVPNRNIPSLQDQPYILELMQLSPGEMIQDNETYGYEYWKKSYIEKLRKSGVNSKNLDYEAEFVKDAETTGKDEMAFRAATFPVVCMHTKEGEVFYMPLGDGEEIINKNTENPYWHGHYPYIDMTAFPEDDEYYSMSVVDAVGDLQIASTEILNQTLTNIRAINNQMYVVGASQATTPDYMFKQRPNGVIRVVGDPGQIVPLRTNDATRSMLAMGQELNAKFEKVGGISSLYSSGAPDKSVNQTARGAQIIDKNIDTNIQMIMDLFGEQVLKRIGDHFQELNAQYVTEEQSFAITGKKGVRSLISIDRDTVGANFDVYTYSESMIKQTPASRQASLQNLLTVINTQVIPSGTQVDLVPLVENLIDSYAEMENVEDIVTSLDEKAEKDAVMLSRGQMPTIKARDSHEELMQIVSIWFEENQDSIPDENKELFDTYIQKHLRFIQAASEVSAMKAQAAALNVNGGGGAPPVQGAETGAQVGDGTLPENTGTGEETPYNLGTIVG
jgi:hypothetical protein